MFSTRHPSPTGKSTPPWPLIVYAVGVGVFAAVFSDPERLLHGSLTLLYGFLAVLSAAVLIAVYRDRPPL